MKTGIRNFLATLVTILLVASANVTLLYGQVVVEDSLRVQLDEIRVEAAYSTITVDEAPMSVTYLMRDPFDIASRPAATMDELTFSLPGVFISNRENYALGERMTIRGLGWRAQFGVRGAHVILDDIPLTVADGQTIMNMIDPATVQRIELLRGPSSTFWGNSSGGVLYLSTRPPADGPAIQYRGYGGSHNTIRQELNFNTRAGDTRIYGYGSYFDTEGFRDHSAARLIRGSIGAERVISDSGNLTFRANYASMPKAQHPGALTEEDAQDVPTAATPNFVNTSAGKTFDQAMVSLAYLHNFESGTFNISTHGTYRDLNNPLPFGYVGLERYAGGVRSTYQFDDLPFDLHIGGELKVQQDDRLETDNINGERGDQIDVQQRETVTNQALFTRVGVPITDRLKLSGGLRADWLRFESEDELGAELEGARQFFSVNPSAGLTFRLTEARIFANFSTSFESPTTVELVNRPEGGNGFNQNLNPERTVSLETGITGQRSAMSYELVLFGMRVNDLLIPFQLEDDGPTFFRNEGQTIHYGVESSFGYAFSNEFDFRIMMTALRAEFDGGDFDGNQIPGVAPFRFGGTVNYRPGNHHFSIDNEWVGSYQVNNANSASTDPYSIFNFRWSVELPNLFDQATLRPFVAVHNLFNTRYNTAVAINAFGNRYFEPGSDISFRAGLQLSLF
ncbi:MAG: TonB-dependent receptor [Balneolaceae bacterium]|nr:TonB-dependent receptor [Balneolaceae bacterium]MCH8548359.1 TonB-dependent receptor [Balneolaceae bacterium]